MDEACAFVVILRTRKSALFDGIGGLAVARK
jgi:hypothetical protein